MIQAWRKVDFGSGTVTFLDDTRKEDMLQVEYPNSFLLDMGWYQDRYIISIIQRRFVLWNRNHGLSTGEIVRRNDKCISKNTGATLSEARMTA